MKRIYLIIAACAILVGAIVAFKSCKGEKAIKVYAEKVEKRDIIEIVSANGKIQPEVELKITSDVSGEIVEMFVKEGERVVKGQKLCRINPDLYESALEKMNATVSSTKANLENTKAQLMQAKSNLANLETIYNRNKKLHDQGATSDQDFESTKTQYEAGVQNVAALEETVKSAQYNVKSTEASLKEANSNLNKTLIFAPVDGTVSKLSKEKGERVVGTAQMEGTEIMRLANLNEMEVSVDVNENDIVRVKKGDEASIEVDAFSKKTFKGIVTEIANSANGLNAAAASQADQVTNYTVKIRILQESYNDLMSEKGVSPFRPGMSASVEVKTKTEKQIISIAIGAITSQLDSTTMKKEDPTATKTTVKKADEKKEYAFILDGKKVKRVEVKTGIQDNYNIQVISGLKEGDLVVSAPYKAVNKELKDGTVVEQAKKEDLFTDKK